VLAAHAYDRLNTSPRKYNASNQYERQNSHPT
jgi:hypothetical protein